MFFLSKVYKIFLKIFLYLNLFNIFDILEKSHLASNLKNFGKNKFKKKLLKINV